MGANFVDLRLLAVAAGAITRNTSILVTRSTVYSADRAAMEVVHTVLMGNINTAMAQTSASIVAPPLQVLARTASIEFMNVNPSEKNDPHTDRSSAPSLLDGTTLVLIPEGEFLAGGAGSAVRTEKAGIEKPFRVHLPAYYLSKYPVTNVQYKRFVDETGHRIPYAVPPQVRHLWHWKNVPVAMPNHPVQRVSKEDAEAYCEWAGLRLPTELEWEKGARGVDGRMYSWGNTWNPRRCRNGLTESTFETCAVDRYPSGKSPWGLYQMVGNTFEWCSDLYEINTYARYQGDPLTFPNPDDNKLTNCHSRLWIVRGGSYQIGPDPGVLTHIEQVMVEQTIEDNSLIESTTGNYEGTELFRCGFRMALMSDAFHLFATGFRCAKDIY